MPTVPCVTFTYEAAELGNLGEGGWPGLFDDIGRLAAVIRAEQTAAKAMFEGARRLADPEAVAGLRSDLPICIAVGEQDPVNGGLALFDALVGRYRDAGLTDVATRVYLGARHEILNETNRAEVISDLLAWTAKAV